MGGVFVSHGVQFLGVSLLAKISGSFLYWVTCGLEFNPSCTVVY